MLERTKPNEKLKTDRNERANLIFFVLKLMTADVVYNDSSC